MAEYNFNPREVAPSAAGGLIPPDWYDCEIVHSEMKQTRQKNGRYMALSFRIINGKQAGRGITVRLNVENPKPETVEIAQRDLSTICHSIGQLDDFVDTAVLHKRPLRIRIITKDSVKYGLQNEAKGYAEYKPETPREPVAQQPWTDGEPPTPAWAR